MNDFNDGLLNRGMIRQVTERWHTSGVALIYVQLYEQSTAVQLILQEWRKEAKVFWHYGLRNDYFFFVSLDALSISPQAGLRELQIKLGRLLLEKQVQHRIGTSTIYPSLLGQSAESIVYEAFKEALGNAEQAAAHDAAVELPTAITKQKAASGYGIEIGELAKPIPTVTYETKVGEIAQLFERNPKLQGAVIVEGDFPIGLIMKEKLHQLLAGQFGLPLYWNRSVTKIMDIDHLVVDASLPVEQVSQMAMGRDYSRLYDVVIITQNRKFIGAASIRSILESITSMRTEAARTANPLTGLPGNEGIQREMKRRIAAGRPFAVIYADLDFFKWFNDSFGFQKGDDLIRYTAEVMQQIISHSGTGSDFVGHIGGDDFIVFTEATDPELLCKQLIWRFDGGIKPLYGEVKVTHVSDRHGATVEQEGVTISLSLIDWDGHSAITPEDISRRAAAIKKQAKAIRGSVYVKASIEQLQHGEGRS